MIKLILLLTLLFPTTVMADDHITADMCTEVAQVVLEAIEEGYINKQEAKSIIGNCYNSL